MNDPVDFQVAEMLQSFLKQERNHGYLKGVCWDWVRAVTLDRCEAYNLICILGRCPFSPTGVHVLVPGHARVFDHIESKASLNLILNQFNCELTLPKEAVGAYVQKINGAISFLTYRGTLQLVEPFHIPLAS